MWIEEQQQLDNNKSISGNARTCHVEANHKRMAAGEDDW
jgi:hypothetical protein